MAKRTMWLLTLCLSALFTACQQSPVAAPVSVDHQPPMTDYGLRITDFGLPTTPLPATLTPATTPTPAMPTATALTTMTPTPYYTGPLSPACGQILPILPTNSAAPTTSLTPDAATLSVLQAMMPAAAAPAWQQLLDHPEAVGLAVYRMGNEANGVYLNADRQMPLASVVKLIPLVAYVEAASSGRLNPASAAPLAALDAYYLPGYDLRAHNRALVELEENGQTVAEGVTLADVPWMMIRHSSNAAADYLHGLLGQEVIEQTAVSLGLASQTAPCPWVGQFLAMGNHTRASSDAAAIALYLENPAAYGREISLLTDAYVNNPDFREAERAWHALTRRPTVETQRYFSHQINAHGSAREYAALMLRLAQNGLSNPDSSFMARRYLEWPMLFPANQLLFSNLGYKNGSLPGILTTVYYAYPQGESTPLVLALFYRDLPADVYREWRQTLPHDEFARWLLAEPSAIPLLRAVIGER